MMNETVQTLLRKPAVVGVVSFGGGLAAGYILAKRLIKTETVVEVREEITQLELDFDAEPATNGKVVYMFPDDETESAYQKSMAAHPSNEPPEEEEDDEPEITVTNVFRNVEGDVWDFDAEIDARQNKQVYVIHHDEFNNDEMGWDDQSCFTFYEGDQVLCNEHDIPVYNSGDIVRELQFGHGSGDPNVVYIRDEKSHTEYEIVRDQGSYEIVVLGGQIEEELEAQDIRHSRHPGKFRLE